MKIEINKQKTFVDEFGNEHNKTEINFNNAKNNKTLCNIRDYGNDDFYIGDVRFELFSNFCEIYEIYENENDYIELKRVFKNYNMNDENTIVLSNGVGDDYYIMINTQYGILLNLTVDLEFNIYHFHRDFIDLYPHDNEQLKHDNYIICLLLDFIITMFSGLNNGQIKSHFEYNEIEHKLDFYERLENAGIYVNGG